MRLVLKASDYERNIHPHILLGFHSCYGWANMSLNEGWFPNLSLHWNAKDFLCMLYSAVKIFNYSFKFYIGFREFSPICYVDMKILKENIWVTKTLINLDKVYREENSL